MIIKTKLYAHRDKDSNWDLWDRLWDEHRPPESMSSPDGQAGRNFSYTALEIEMEAEVDMATGSCWITHFQGHKLPQRVSI